MAVGSITAEGHEILLARNGEEALAQVKKLAPDVILLDVMMPDISGFDVCKTLKIDDRWRHIPIILVTALPGRDDMMRGFEAGADDFLSKPFDNIELCARVRSMLRIKNQYDLLEKQRRDAETVLHLREELARVTTHRLEELEILHQVGLNLMNSLDASYMMELISRTTFKLISGAAYCVVYFLSDDEERLVPTFFSRENGTQPILPNLDSEEIIQQAIDIKETVYIPDLPADLDFTHLDLGETRAVLVIPLIVDNRAMGALSIDSLEADAFETGDRRVLSILATQLAVSIMKARLFAELGGVRV